MNMAEKSSNISQVKFFNPTGLFANINKIQKIFSWLKLFFLILDKK